MNSSPISPHVVIAGGTGFLGTSLAEFLTTKGTSVTVLSRKPGAGRAWQHAVWDARTPGDWCQSLEGAVALINLTGRTVDCVKTPDHQDEILRSRVESTQVLGEAMRGLANPPPVWVQMSTAHIYGDPPELRCTEASPTGYGLAPFVGKAWEEAFAQALRPEQRGVVLRTGFVLGRDRGAGQGAMARLTSVARWGLGGRVGHGRQGMSWIHEADMNQIFWRAIMEPQMKGIYNATGPNPVSQSEFMRTLRRAMGVPLGLPAPEPIIRLGAKWVLRTDPDLALYGRYVLPERLNSEGFVFQFPKLPRALADLFER